ncbi:hypothetical protein SAMN04487886_11014 [Clostridium sp. DSM 8431]|uniref:hypothetical protein n=1 Tax=Clostridium sp. DSM 8431 TaxID=1761781 RepID=UPI0008E56D3E|nr:hypothetical protein [Clostridium sp. DSM 8431]SFU68373.1 hypothetical protein SAMN04487886_11014 [Clostridium sp. DSM 8431]
MAKQIACSLIIKDDFHNVLILKKKVKRGQIESWSILTQKIKGKENHDKCITRGAKDILKSVIFDVEPFKEYICDEENDESIMVYTGRIKEKAILDKNYKECKWIGKRNLEDYNFLPLDKEILTDFFAE